jgi:hypothetical protein
MNIKEMLLGIGIIGIVLFGCGCIDYSVVPGGYECEKAIDGGEVLYGILLAKDGGCGLGTGIQLSVDFVRPKEYVGRWEQEDNTIYMEFTAVRHYGGPWQRINENVVAEWDGKTLTIISAGKNLFGGSIIDEGMILKKSTNAKDS